MKTIYSKTVLVGIVFVILGFMFGSVEGYNTYNVKEVVYQDTFIHTSGQSETAALRYDVVLADGRKGYIIQVADLNLNDNQKHDSSGEMAIKGDFFVEHDYVRYHYIKL